MATGRDIVKDSMRLFGAIATGETPSAEEVADGLTALNKMLDSWSNNGLTIHASVREKFSLTANDGIYTLGSAANFNTTRPLKFDAVTIEDQSVSPLTESAPLRILNSDEWAAIAVKDQTADKPSCVYFEGTYPLETVNLWPVPTVANKVVFYSRKPLTTLTSANTSFSLPPGYLEAITYNLAKRFAPEFGKTLQPEQFDIAAKSLADIKRTNKRPALLEVDDALMDRSVFNIFTME